MRLVAFVLLAGVLACASTESGPPPTAAPVQAVATSPGAPQLQRHEVSADDGHPLTVWHRAAAKPHGVVVLVHGRTWSSRPDFDLQVPGESRSLMQALAARGFEVYAIDLRGYGGTPRDDTGWLTPDRAASDLASVLDFVAARHPDLRRPAVLGWSLGSLVAQLCVQQHPAALSDLVLYGYPRDPEGKNPPGPPAGAEPPREATTAAAAAEDFIAPTGISRAMVDAFVRAALAADPVRVDWRATDELDALDPAKVHVPTLVIHGELDPYAPIAHQAALFSRLGDPDRQWVVLPGGDHAAHLEATGPRFVQAVVAFLNRPRAPVRSGG